jgi:hypothetical protein
VSTPVIAGVLVVEKVVVAVVWAVAKAVWAAAGVIDPPPGLPSNGYLNEYLSVRGLLSE